MTELREYTGTVHSTWKDVPVDVRMAAHLAAWSILVGVPVAIIMAVSIVVVLSS